MEVLGFLVAIFLGALIGLQREYEQQHTKISRFAGIRTFILITFLGSILGYLSFTFENYIFITIGFIAVTLMSLLSYYLAYLKYKDNTATTEVTAILAFMIGVLCTLGFLTYAIIFGILIAVFLTFKEKFHVFAKKMKRKELFAIVKFALIALVILPLLPRQEYSPMDVPILNNILLSMNISPATLQQLSVFNPYNIWLMVILVAGISFLGYVLVKLFGTKKGYGLAGFVGGLISSTAVTLSMAAESKKYKKITSPFVIAVVIASATSFIRILIEVMVINSSLVKMVIIPIGLMGLIGYLSAFVLYIKKDRKQNPEKIKVSQPFNIMTAIKFGLFFALVIFVAKFAQIIFGQAGLYIASIFSGLADVDAITLTMSSLSKMGQISQRAAVASIILAVSSNTLVKAGMAWFLGEKKFAKYISVIFFLILFFGLGSLFLFF